MQHDGCKLCKYEHEQEDSKHCLGCAQNATDKYVRVTNADRIRNMDDEELASAILKITGDETMEYCIDKKECLDAGEIISVTMCQECLFLWLQQKAEDVPAIENPDFRKAVDDMVKKESKQSHSKKPEGVSKSSGGKEKTKKDICLKLYKKGMTAKEIANKTGVPYPTVTYHIRTHKKMEQFDQLGWNADRHACKTCKYKFKHGKGCDYYAYTDKERGCDVEWCDKYEKE